MTREVREGFRPRGDSRSGLPRWARIPRPEGLLDVEKALVLGLGESGTAAAEVLAGMGVEVVANDAAASLEEGRKAHLEGLGCRVVLGSHPLELLEGVDLLVPSPGIPPSNPLLAAAQERGLKIWSEVELGWRLARGPVVAITGTNGKSTTVRMTELVINRAVGRCRAAGNIGYPLARAALEAEEGEILVVEVSSFQLYFVEAFRPVVGVLLNVGQDHLDWHRDMEDYLWAKSRIWACQREEDFAVVNLDDPLCRKAVTGAPGELRGFSVRGSEEAFLRLEGEAVVAMLGEGTITLVERSRLAIPGEHNLENYMAAAAVGLLMGGDPEAVAEAMADFRCLPHRLEWVGRVEGVDFYDDSKATNPHAALRALRTFQRPVRIILGGRNKGLGFQELAREISDRVSAGLVREVLLMGEAAEEIRRTLEETDPRVPIRVFSDLEEVFWGLRESVKPGEAVLLSPACASFDQYEGYEQRGNHFQELVRKWREELQGEKSTPA
jgi:UDP-N-acetylmuramoylalanine--D-glutamate ligase